MASLLRIPDRYKPGLRLLAELPDDQVERLRAALAEIPSRLTMGHLARQATEAVPEVGNAHDILEAVLSLIPLLDDDVGLSADLVRDVSASPDLELDEDARERFADRLR